MSFHRALTLLFFATLCSVNQTWAREDHPMIAAYPGAKIQNQQVQAYEPYKIPTSIVDISSEPYKYTFIDNIGNLSRHYYEIGNTSSLKVYENYLAAIKKLGFTLIFSCELNSCGDDDQATALGGLLSIHGDVLNGHYKPYYLVGEKQGAQGKIYAAWFIGAYESDVSVQQVIFEVVPLDNTLIKVDPSYLTKAAAPATENTSESELAKDHKLLTRYPNAKLQNVEKIEAETFSLPPASNASNQTPLKITGDLSRHFYEISNVSTLKVYENYKHALTKAGFTFLSECKLSECGNDESVQALGAKIAIANDVYNGYGKPYYILAKKSAATGNIYVSLFIGGYQDTVSLQQVIMEEKGVETGLISIDADSLKQQIDADGKALIYGIYFDTGKATVKPESKPTLDAIAQLLNKNKELLLYVVGHTDDTGSGAANVELSLQRATAVVNELTTAYKIPASRLQAQGVGPYAPAGNNTSDAGKQKNRRVELVKRLQ